VSASAGAVVSGQSVNWNLGNLKAGANGTVTVTASVAAAGTYINQADLSFLVSLTPRTVTGSGTSTVRNTTQTSNVTMAGGGCSSGGGPELGALFALLAVASALRRRAAGEK
jgi:hypothetical protein